MTTKHSLRTQSALSHTLKGKISTKPEHIIYFTETFGPDVILLDMNFTKDADSGQEGFFWLEKIKETDPDAVVIFVTATTLSY